MSRGDSVSPQKHFGEDGATLRYVLGTIEFREHWISINRRSNRTVSSKMFAAVRDYRVWGVRATCPAFLLDLVVALFVRSLKSRRSKFSD